jgi:hypothetical protein
MIEVAELMVQEAMSFSGACMALGQKFDDSASERAAQYSEAFRNILDALEFRYYARTGDNPLLTKGYLAGRLVWAIDELARQSQPDKIAMPGKLLADLMGWLDEKPDAPVIANLTQTDLDRIRAELKAQEGLEKTAKSAVTETPEPEKKPN